MINFEKLLSTQEEWNHLAKFVERDLTDVRDPGQSRFRVSKGRYSMLKYKVLQQLAGAEVRTVYQRLESLHGGWMGRVRQCAKAVGIA